MPLSFRPAVSPWFCCAAAVLAAIASTCAAAQPAYTFTKIAESATLRYADPVVNGQGAVAYRTLSEEAIYRYAGGTTTKIADATGSLQFLSGLDMNDSGRVVFVARLDNSVEDGIFAGDGQSLATIATFGTPSPLGGPFTAFGGFPSINNAGTVAFVGRGNGRSGVFTSNGSISTIADDSGPLQSFGLNSSAINDSGIVAFRAAFDDRPLMQGVFTGGGGAMSTIGEGNANEELTASSLSDSGVLVFHNFRGVGEGGGIFTGNGGPVEVVIDRTDSFSSGLGDRPSINGAGLVAFTTVDAQSTPGIYTGPTADKVIQHGDALFNSTVRNLPGTGDLAITSHSLNDAGQIAFTYLLSNGNRGVALATPVPEPSGIALVTTTVCYLCSSRLRRKSLRD